MLKAFPTLLLRMLALAGLAAMAALLANSQAAPARRLAWFGSNLSGPSRPAVVQPANPPATPAPTTLPTPAVESSLTTKPLRPERPLPPQPPLPVASAPLTSSNATAPNPIQDISGAQAWQAFQKGVPFLDARRSADFTAGHIAKAFSTPVWESDLEERLFAFKAARRPGPEDAIVIYCGGGDCRDSHLLAARLLNEGYFHLLIFRDGFPAWVAQGHPIEKGHP